MSVRDESIDPRLLESARKEFMEHGFLKAELKTICDNAGVTTGAVYKRYKGKEELFCAVVKDTADTLDDFVSLRTQLEFSSMTDKEVRETWIMNERFMLDLFRMLWKIRSDFVLLLEKSAGTAYENYGHDFALRMTKAYMQYYLEAKKRGSSVRTALRAMSPRWRNCAQPSPSSAKAATNPAHRPFIPKRRDPTIGRRIYNRPF